MKLKQFILTAFEGNCISLLYITGKGHDLFKIYNGELVTSKTMPSDSDYFQLVVTASSPGQFHHTNMDTAIVSRIFNL